MATNQLVRTLPSTVNVGGFVVPIETSYKIWIQVWQIQENPNIEAAKKFFGILYLAYPAESTPIVANHKEEALKQALAFLDRTLGDTTPPRPLTQREKRIKDMRLFDWDWDSSRVIADFMREYNIDLTDDEQDMHWWRFMSLFNGLSDTSATMEAISIRAADIDAKGMSAEQKKHLRERKASLLLPARTDKEAAHNRQMLRGC